MTFSHYMLRMLALALPWIAISASAECVSFTDAHQHIGKTQCVRGTIFHVKEGSKGVTFLDFCENFETCPFTVVVFASDLKHVGDVRQLKGRAIEIKGTVQDYDGRAEIILRHPQQLGKNAGLVHPFPKAMTSNAGANTVQGSSNVQKEQRSRRKNRAARWTLKTRAKVSD